MLYCFLLDSLTTERVSSVPDRKAGTWDQAFQYASNRLGIPCDELGMMEFRGRYFILPLATNDGPVVEVIEIEEVD